MKIKIGKGLSQLLMQGDIGSFLINLNSICVFSLAKFKQDISISDCLILNWNSTHFCSGKTTYGSLCEFFADQWILMKFNMEKYKNDTTTPLQFLVKNKSLCKFASMSTKPIITYTHKTH